MGGPASEAQRGDGAKRKSVRKSCRSAGDHVWKTMRQHREAAVRSGKKLASGSSGARRAEAGRQKPAGVQLFCVTAVVPTVGAELAFWQAYGCYEVLQSLEFERCELHVFAHYVYHLFVLCAVAVHILLKYLL